MGIFGNRAQRRAAQRDRGSAGLVLRRDTLTDSEALAEVRADLAAGNSAERERISPATYAGLIGPRPLKLEPGVQYARWVPPFCGCVLEERLDTTTGAQTVNAVFLKCLAHQGISDANLMGVLLTNPDSEQKRISWTLKELWEGNYNLSAADPAGGGLTWKNGVSWTISWTGVAPNRVLNVSIVGQNLTAQQKNTLTTRLTTILGGAGKVVVV